MSSLAIGIAGVAGLLGVLFLRVPIGTALILVGVGGYAAMDGWRKALFMLGSVPVELASAYSLSVVPLFILMGAIASRAGMSRELFNAANGIFSGWRGALTHATIGACAAFGSICGSSIATAATFSKVAYPSMRRFGYKDSLSAGAIAAGGTLGILIPPSVIMVIYGIMTESNIGKLFVAGILPGIAATLLLCLAVLAITWRDPAAGPPAEPRPWSERLSALARVWPVLVLFIAVIGGIYGGVFTATEGAGIGAGGAFVFAAARRALSFAVLVDVLVESARTTSMLFMILIGAFVFANFINYTTMPADLRSFVTYFELRPIMVIVAICAVYVILGTAMEELSMILLTVPLFFPVVTGLGYDPIWFGIIVVIVVQIGLISPPVGMNIFVVKNLIRHLSIGTVFRGVWPFTAAQVALLGLVVAFPQMATYLPQFMK